MGIWTSLFGKTNLVNKLVDGIYDGVDAVVYTDEEKVANRKELLKLYEPFKIAQRLLALTFSIPYALAWFITFISTLLGKDVTSQIAVLSGTMGQIVLAIVGFYFLGGIANGFSSSKTTKD